MNDQNNNPLNAKLFELVQTYRNHFWQGEYPPFTFTCGDMLECDNMRLSPGHHQRYDVVWLYEEDLAEIGAGKYELVLDEAIRLIGETGKLVVRYSQNSELSVIRLKAFLGRRLNAEIRVDAEWNEEAIWTTVFDVRRRNLETYRRSDWTFALVSRGTRQDNVLAFLKSVRNQDPEFEHEIIISGPECDSLYGEFGVRYVTDSPDKSRPYRDELAEISRKKNDIVDIAAGANILIAHDRYKLDDNFFSGFRQFGYDFDFASVLQSYENGTRFPAYVATEGPPLTWQVPLDCANYNYLHPTHYLNGGFLVAKTETLRSVRFNEMLFWNQAEDLELSQHFRSLGLPPRMNCFSSATTIGITPEHTKMFRPFPILGTQPSVRFVDALRNSGRKFERKIRRIIRTIRGRAA